MNLYRKLQPKSKWDKYIPKTNCQQTELGNGDTNFGVKMIKDWAIKHAWQTKEIGKQLQVSSLIDTLKNVHKFAYSNFQYHPDYELQHIQSLSCAWKMRESGINCKGYSTIISSILYQLGIRHYIRRVNFEPGEFTHVFIVVPYKQTELIMDATLPTFNYTTNYLQHKDLEVMPNKLRYIGLNSPNNQQFSKQKAIDTLTQILASKGVQNVRQIAEFLNKIPAGQRVTLYPFAIKYQTYLMPIQYAGLSDELAEALAKQHLQPKQLNGYEYGGGAFGGNFGGIDSSYFNLGGSGSSSSSGQSNGAVWNGIANAGNALANVINSIWNNGGNSGGNTGGNSGGNTGGNTGGNSGGNSGGNNALPVNIISPGGNQTGGYNNNYGNGYAGVPPYHPPQQNNSSFDFSKLIKPALIITGVGVVGYGAKKLIDKKANKK